MKSTHKIQLSVILTFIFFNYKYVVKILFEILNIVSNDWTVVSEYLKLTYEEGRENIRLDFILVVNPDSKCEDVGVSWLSFKNQSICK